MVRDQTAVGTHGLDATE